MDFLIEQKYGIKIDGKIYQLKVKLVSKKLQKSQKILIFRMEKMFKHYSVLLEEAVEGLNIKEDGIYVDCTLGGAGHSLEILKKLTTGKLYAFDQDNVAT